MRSTEVQAIGVSCDGQVFVKPCVRESSFRFIYRTASGVRWDEEAGFFCSVGRQDWSVSKWFCHIRAGVQEELGIDLVVTADTKWIDVEAEHVKSIREICGEGI